MKFSPQVRAILTAIAAAIAALAVLLPTLTGVPTWVGVVIGVTSAVLGALGIVPPQVGGTQQGLANPSIVEPPPADVVPKP